jgi:hypothetical protein
MGYSLGTLDNVIGFGNTRTGSYWETRQWNNFDPANLTQRLTEVGKLSGNFDNYESMALAGEMIILLSHRATPHAIPESGLHAMVSAFLYNKGFAEAGEIYGRLYGADVCDSSAVNDGSESKDSDLDDYLSISPCGYSQKKIEVFLEELEEITA